MVKKPKVKICSKCDEEKVLDDFYFDDRGTHNRRAECKKCQSTQKKQAYEDSRDEPISVARRILKGCKQREKERLAKFVKRVQNLDYLPEVELTDEQFDLDVDWVLEQRDKQKNKCYYTGLEMIWSTGLIDKIKRIDPLAVTIERLNSSKGYVKENCVLTCWRANCFKGDGTIEEMLRFAACIMARSTKLKKIKV